MSDPIPYTGEIPEAQWGELLAHFSRAYEGAKVCLQIVDASGGYRLQKGHHREELDLLEVAFSKLNGQNLVRVTARQAPEGSLVHAELVAVTRIAQEPELLWIGSADGSHLSVQVITADAQRG